MPPEGNKGETSSTQARDFVSRRKLSHRDTLRKGARRAIKKNPKDMLRASRFATNIKIKLSCGDSNTDCKYQKFMIYPLIDRI
jgi:hypothetical protein